MSATARQIATSLMWRPAGPWRERQPEPVRRPVGDPTRDLVGLLRRQQALATPWRQPEQEDATRTGGSWFSDRQKSVSVEAEALPLPLDLDVERPNVCRLGRDQRHGGPGRARDPRVAGRRCAAPQARHRRGARRPTRPAGRDRHADPPHGHRAGAGDGCQVHAGGRGRLSLGQEEPAAGETGAPRRLVTSPARRPAAPASVGAARPRPSPAPRPPPGGRAPAAAPRRSSPPGGAGRRGPAPRAAPPASPGPRPRSVPATARPARAAGRPARRRPPPPPAGGPAVSSARPRRRPPSAIPGETWCAPVGTGTGASRQVLDLPRPLHRNAQSNPIGTRIRVPDTCPAWVHPYGTAVMALAGCRGW